MYYENAHLHGEDLLAERLSVSSYDIAVEEDFILSDTDQPPEEVGNSTFYNRAVSLLPFCCCMCRITPVYVMCYRMNMWVSPGLTHRPPACCCPTSMFQLFMFPLVSYASCIISPQPSEYYHKSLSKTNLLFYTAA